jgi:hypothetical protein
MLKALALASLPVLLQLLAEWRVQKRSLPLALVRKNLARRFHKGLKENTL